MSTITGKSALITGGGSGIGLGCASRLVQDGAHVTICGRTEDKLVAAVDVIAAQAADGATVRHIVADVTVEDEIAAANAFAAEVTGGLDILVANAGGERMPRASQRSHHDTCRRKVSLVTRVSRISSKVTDAA